MASIRSRYKSPWHGFHVSLCRWLVHLTFGAVAGIDFGHLGFLRLGHLKNPLLGGFVDQRGQGSQLKFRQIEHPVFWP